jgi:hypothetical protein
MRTALVALLSLCVCLYAASARAEPLVEPSSELKFEKSPTIDGKPYLCLGVGIRKKAIFKVYALAFCVEEAAGRAELQKFLDGAGKGKSADELAEDPAFFKVLIDLPVDKAAQLVFVRDVSKDKMRESFDESLTKALGKAQKSHIDSFLELLDNDLKSGDKLAVQTKPDGSIRVGLNGDLKDRKDPILAPALWQPYLGADSVSGSLKKSVASGVAALRK